MSVDENKAIVRRYQEAYNANNLDALDEVVAANIGSRAPAYPGLPPGLEGAKQAHRLNLAYFPDFQVRIEEMIAEGDKVAVRFTASGTHTGKPFLGVSPSGKRFEITGISIFRIGEGKIVEHWAVEDELGILQQVGVRPTPGR